jgi:hypothetical protein
MARNFVAAVLLAFLTANHASAARTEVSVPGLPGQTRFVYDSTTRQFKIELEGKDAFAISRELATSNVSLSSPGFVVSFNEGAAKGMSIVQTDGTAMTTTAGEFNWLTYGPVRILHSPTTSGGTTTPAGVAAGLDLGDGNATDDDVDEYFLGGVLGSTGRPFTVGTDPAFYTCATIQATDTADSEEFLVGFQAPGSTGVTAVPQNATLGSHINYYLVGEYDTAATCTTACPIYALAGIAGTDTTQDTAIVAADATDYRICVYVSSAGVTTATVNGATGTALAATMADGVQLVPYIKLKQNGTDDTDQIVKAWEAGFQEVD